MTQQSTPPRRRFRFPWLFASLVLGVSAAIACYRGQTPLYPSFGFIEIKPTLPRIFDSSPDNTIPMFDQFMDAQVRRIVSRRTVDLAMLHSTWQEVRPGTGEQAVSDFMQHFTASRSGQVLEIRYLDPDPKIALVAVDSLIRAYQKLFGEYTDGDDAVRIEALTQVRQNAETDIQKYSNLIRANAGDYTPDTLRQLYEAKITELTRAQADSNQADLMLKIAEESRRPAAAPLIWMPEKIAQYDPAMKDLLADRAVLEAKIDHLSQDPGVQASAMQEARTDLNTLDDKIALYTKQFQDKYTAGAQKMEAAGVVSIPDGNSGNSRLTTIDELRARARQHREEFERIHMDALELGRKCQEVAFLETQRQSVQKRLDEVKQNLETLSVESRVGGHLSVISYGDLANAPFNDHRPRSALLAGITGMFGTLLLAGLAKITFPRRPA